MGGSCPSRAMKFLYEPEWPEQGNKFLYAPAPPSPTVWALKLPLRALVHKTTYAPMIYTALCIMFWMRAYPLLGQVGGGWAPGNLEFFWAPIGSFPFHRAQKTIDFQPPPTCPCNGYARLQNIMHGAV
jgi:hypothetical protein